jgi:hypothetical protein
MRSGGTPHLFVGATQTELGWLQLNSKNRLLHARMFRRRAAAALAAAGALVMSSGLVVMSGGSATADPDVIHKSYVCKYTGKPGADEHLQTGQNPIWVDNHSLGVDGPTSVGQHFGDEHDHSVVIVANTRKLDPEPTVTSCPPGDHGTHSDDRDTRDLPGVLDCRAGTFTVEHQERTRSYTWDGDSWVAGDWSAWTTSGTTVTDATAGQCPDLPPDNCTNLVGNQPSAFPCTKQGVTGADRSEGTPNCATSTIEVFSTPWKQEWAFAPGENGGSWSLGTKQYGDKVKVGTRDATASECPSTPPSPVDVCSNIPGNQPSIPGGFESDGNGGCVKPVVVPADACTNLPGVQETVPEGYEVSGSGDCAQVLGVETMVPQPKPTKHTHAVQPEIAPTVLGTEAIAPTAVDAGLASWPSSQPTTTSSRSLLAQGLVGGGLFMLVAAGWLGIPARKRGARQA